LNYAINIVIVPSAVDLTISKIYFISLVVQRNAVQFCKGQMRLHRLWAEYVISRDEADKVAADKACNTECGGVILQARNPSLCRYTGNVDTLSWI
jgi:hypothetical protein